MMTSVSPGVKFLIITASFVVVAAGMKAAAPILVPFLLALFITLISAPPLLWMQDRGVSRAVALLVVVAVMLGFGFFFTILISNSVNDFTRALPAYQENMQRQVMALADTLHQLGVTISKNFIRDTIDTRVVMQLTSNVLLAVSSVVTNVFFILLMAIFMLMEASSFPTKLQRIMNAPERSIDQVKQLLDDVKRYIFLKTVVSLGTGAFVAIWLAIFGVDQYVLWGLLAFLLNYVPNVGSIIAAIPAVLLALFQGGFDLALWAALGYVIVNVGVGSVLEPRLMGRGLGLSTLVVLLSLVFWGYILGPVGMLLSIPLTMMVKIGLEGNAQTRWVSILLGPAED